MQDKKKERKMTRTGEFRPVLRCPKKGAKLIAQFGKEISLKVYRFKL